MVLAFYFATAATCALVTYGLVRWQSRVLLVDVPNHRSSHVRPRPRAGGIALYAAFLAGYLLWRPSTAEGRWLLAGGTASFLLGLLDDLFCLSVASRLTIEFLTAGLIAALGARIETVQLPGLPLWRLSPGVSVVLTAFWCTGFLNAFNFMDGSDGLAAGEAVLVGLFMAALSFSPWPLIASASALGFLLFNREPARIFMGDSGSYLLGFLLAFSAVIGTQKGAPIIVYFLFTGTFLLDTAVTLARRILRREDCLTAHRSHHYQRLLSLEWSHAAVARFNAALTLCLGAAGLAYARVSPAAQLLVLALVAGAFTYGCVWVGRREKQAARS